MAQQIKKKYIQDGAIDGSKLKLLEGQSIVQESSEGDVELIKLDDTGKVIVSGKETAFKEQVEAETSARESAINSLQGSLTQEISDRQSADSTLQSNIDAEESARQTADSNLQSQVDTERGRIDSILLASDADKDSFKEIVDLINSVDTENDNAFAAYVLSNDAALAQEVSDRQSADSALQSSIDAEASARQSADQSLQSTIDSLNASSDVIFEDSAATYADGAAPVASPKGHDGWYYISAGSPDKINWYFFSSDNATVTVDNFTGMYAVGQVDSDSSDCFHLAYYTVAQGDGNDAGSWYRSRQVYCPSGDFSRGKKCLFYVGQEPSADVYPDLERVEMTLSTISSVGPNDGSEVLLTTVLGTNSATSAGSVEILMNRLGFNSSSYDKEYSLEIRDQFNLSGIKQSILEEVGRRQKEDSLLEDSLNTEISDRAAADTAIKEYKPSQILYVSKNGSDTNVGSEQLPFLTIGAALAAITDASPTNRYALRISAGQYDEADISLKPNVFLVGENAKEAVRINAQISLDSDFSGNSDHRSGIANALILKACDFDWDSVTSAAGKLYFSQTVFGSTVNMNGHTSSIAQAQFADCQIFGKLSVSGINISVFHNNICWGDVDLNQHPNAGMATIFNAIGGTIGGKLKATSTGSDFNRRCSAFLKSCFTGSIEIDGAVSYVDVTNDSLPSAGATTSNGGNLVRLNDEGLKKDLSNLSYPTAVNQPILPAASNTTNLGDWNKQWMFNFAYVHGSSGSDLYIISTMGAYDAAGDDTGRTIYIQADTYGLKENVDGGDISLSTTSVSGTGVRGKISLDAREVDLSDSQIKNLADGTDATDAVTKQQLDVEKERIDAILEAADADKDSFKEIVDLINSVDTENDNAFAAYALSNDAALAQEVSDRQSADSSLQSEIDAAEGRLDSLEARAYKKEKFTLSSTDISNGYVDLGFEARENSIRAFVGRLAIHEGVGEDYTVSVVGGVTRVTFVGNMVTPSEEQLTAGDVLHFSYEA